MKKKLGGSVFFIFIFIVFAQYGYGFHEEYPPFDSKSLESRRLKASPINKPEGKGSFENGDVVISWMTKDFESSTVEIRYKKELVEKVELPDGREWSDFLGGIYYVDLDHNGLPDIILSPADFGSGLGAFYKTVLIYFQTTPGNFNRLEFTSFYFKVGDFADLKGDGKLELLVMQLAQLECSDKKIHSFWVYVPYEIKGYNLVMEKDSYREFPKFIWFTHKPNSQPTDKLSTKEKNEYLETLPALIESVPISK